MSARLTVEEARQAGLLPEPELAPKRKPRGRVAAAKSKGEEAFALQCEASSYALPCAPVRQYPWAKPVGRKFTSDFAWPSLRILVEVEGGVWRRGGGAHSHPTNILRDLEKQNLATLLGYQVLRFTTDQVVAGDAIAFTVRVIRAREEGR